MTRALFSCPIPRSRIEHTHSVRGACIHAGGGATTFAAGGSWFDPHGVLCDEPVVVLQVAADETNYSRVAQAFMNLAGRLLDLGEEAVLVQRWSDRGYTHTMYTKDNKPDTEVAP